MSLTTPRLLGVAAAAVCVVLLVLVFFPPTWPWQQTFQVSLAAQPFGQLNSDATVELGGVKVGKVAGLDVVNGQALVRLQIDRQYESLLHADTSATIRPHGLLGPEYVDLNGGSGGSGSLVEGAVVPSSRVKVATDVDQVLNSLQPDVRQSLQTLIRELGRASDGRGQDLNDSVKALGDASNDLTTVTGTVHTHDGDLQTIIDTSEQLSRDLQYAPVDAQLRDTNQVLGGLAEVNGSLGNGVDHTANVLAALDVILNGNAQNLSYTLGKAPDLVTRLRALLAEFTTILKAVNPSLPALMTAIVETQSAFGGHDANGNFVRIQTILGSCIAGLNINCSGGPSAGGPPVTIPGTQPAPAPAAPTAAQAPTSPTPAPRMSDQDLIGLLRGLG